MVQRNSALVSCSFNFMISVWIRWKLWEFLSHHEVITAFLEVLYLAKEDWMTTSQNTSSVKDAQLGAPHSGTAIWMEDVLRFRVLPSVYEEKRRKTLQFISLVFSFYQGHLFPLRGGFRKSRHGSAVEKSCCIRVRTSSQTQNSENKQVVAPTHA